MNILRKFLESKEEKKRKKKKKEEKKRIGEFLIEKLLAPLIIGIIIPSFSLFLVLVIQKEKEQIVIGFTAHSTFETDSHKDLLKDNMTEPVNNILGELETKYEFTPVVVGSSKYDDVFKGLNTGYVDLAFLSPYAYLEKVFQKDPLLDRFVYIGNKQSHLGSYYYSGITIPKKLAKNLCMASYSELQNSKYFNLQNFLKKENIKYILNKKENSTSTHIIPKIILYHEDLSKELIYLSRKNMISILLNQDTINLDTIHIGFLSNEDWLYACKQDEKLKKMYSFIYFDQFPIPYDPVFANEFWYNDKGSRELDRIWKLLRLTLNSNNIENRNAFQNSWLKDNSDFIDLVFSGRIEKQDSDSIKIVFNDNNIQKQFIESLKNKKWEVCFVERKSINGEIKIDTIETSTNNLVDAKWNGNIACLQMPKELKDKKKIFVIIPKINELIRNRLLTIGDKKSQARQSVPPHRFTPPPLAYLNWKKKQKE